MEKLSRHLGVSKSALTIGLLLVAIWTIAIVATGANVNLFPVKWNFTNSGAFGDSFGPLSAFMASVAALSAIAAYRSQAAEVSRLIDRQKLEDQRRNAELEQSQSRQAENEKALYKNRFEETFFKLLETFRSIVSQVDIKTSAGPVKVGHDAFESIEKYARRSAEMQNGNLESAWNDTSNNYKNDLNHYFRFLYHIILFVNDSQIENKYFYVRLIRALLSESEIVLLGLNCEYGEGRGKFRQLVEKYSLLHNISIASRNLWFRQTCLAGSAFGR